MKKQTNQPKQIILLNGPSSSGKSMLSLALRDQLDDSLDKKYFIVSVDDFVTISTNKAEYEKAVFEISGNMCKATLAALKKHDGVIIDHVITSERIFNQLKEMLDPHPILLVQVTCPLAVLTEREEVREDRCMGSAEASYECLFPKHGYDITVDTHYTTPKMCALNIIYKYLV